jgi:hypothetical protein
MKVDHRGSHHLLDLESAEVALLLDILEAALGAEAISGPGRSNPPLARLFNDLYSGLLETARAQWGQGPAPLDPQGSAVGSPSRSNQLHGRSMPPGTLQIPSPRRRANPSTAL